MIFDLVDLTEKGDSPHDVIDIRHDNESQVSPSEVRIIEHQQPKLQEKISERIKKL